LFPHSYVSGFVCGFQIFIAMGMGSLSHYEVDFIAAFLEATSVFYAREAAHWLQNDTYPTFLLKVEARLNQERRRLEDFLHASTHDKLFEVLHQQLLLKHQEAVLTKESGIKAMLRARATQDITRMYKLYAAVPSSLPFIARLFKELVISVGEELIARLTAENDSGKYIEELLSMHDRFYELTTTCFDDAGVFHFALKDAFEHIVNLAAMGSSTAELLSSFCDKLLTKGGIENEGALQESLDKVVKIFTYLTDKDLFSDFYRKQLAKRLLMLRSVSNDAERSMIGKLKLKCGAQFTSKFEGMMNDMNLGADTTALFEQWMLTERASCGFEMSVQVLTTGFWPSYKSEAVNLPHEMTRSTTIFQRFYDTRTAHRRLAWIHHLGTATVVAFYGQQPVDVVCSTYQCLILLLFNGLSEISIEDVGKVTGIPKEDVKQALRPLVMGQYKLLVKDPVEGFSTSHKIRVNTAFTSPKRQIKIPLLNNKVSDEERSKTVADVSEERIHVIEACIVRLMKARQTMDHQQLVSEVTQQMVLSAQFRPDPKAIKKRIEDLITREYMERVTNGANTSYKYMA
jgi:cullin 1